MSDSALQRLLDHNRENQITLWTKSLDASTRTAGWALAGNAGALVLCFNAAISGDISAWWQFRVLGAVFSVGMIAAFSSVVLEQKSFEIFSQSLANFVAKGTSALALTEQINAIAAMPDDHVDAETVAFVGDLRVQLTQAQKDLVSIDLAPKDAKHLLNQSNYALGGSCVALILGVAVALLLLPGAVAQDFLPPKSP
jgi:hypothetical protein